MPTRARRDVTPQNKTDLVPGDWNVTIAADTSASLVLKKSGTVEYYCRFHPNMKGRIAVTSQ